MDTKHIDEKKKKPENYESPSVVINSVKVAVRDTCHKSTTVSVTERTKVTVCWLAPISIRC